MITFKSKKTHPHDVWASEIRLKECDSARRANVLKLLKKLDKEGFDESVS